MTDFFDKGFSLVELCDPALVLAAWLDVDRNEIERLLKHPDAQPSKILTMPRTPNFDAFVQRVTDVS